MSKNLIELLPDYYHPILEFQQIMTAHGAALEEFERNIQLVYNNFYVQTCDEKTLKVYEKWFGLIPSAGDTLEYRRELVLSKFQSKTPFSIGYLRDRLTELFGDDYTLAVDPVACTLTVSLTSSRYGAVTLLYTLLYDIVPAHMQIISNQQVENIIKRKLYHGAVPGSSVHQYI
jgi:hypothetical protein